MYIYMYIYIHACTKNIPTCIHACIYICISWHCMAWHCITDRTAERQRDRQTDTLGMLRLCGAGWLRLTTELFYFSGLAAKELQMLTEWHVLHKAILKAFRWTVGGHNNMLLRGLIGFMSSMALGQRTAV